MTDLDEIWAEMLRDSETFPLVPDKRLNADLATLRATNDEIRHRAIEWLFSFFTRLAAHANRRNIPISIEREDDHNFPAFGANMVGGRISLRHGVRCLTVEAGWTRRPSDGFMRGGALAVAHIRHFGVKGQGADLALLKNSNGHEWFAIDVSNTAHRVEPEDLARHLAVLVHHAK